MALEPITRAEQIMSGEGLTPITREEMFLAKAAGQDVETPTPITRREMFLSQISGGSGGGVSINNQDKTITQNGTYTADEGYTGFGTVNVNVARDDQTDIDEQWIRAIERDSSKLVTEIPTGLTKIGSNAFYRCQNLAITSLPDGVTSIGSSAFYGCIGITSISLPDGVTSVATYAFQNCYNLAEVTFKGKPNTVDSGAFKSCTSIHTINVPWAEGAVANAPWGATNATINYNYTGG